jgi:UDP-N-acetylmuramate dehydrogenase
MEISSLTTNRFSFYRTNHTFLKYASFSTIQEFCEYYSWAKENKAAFYILGNGSNTLFTRGKVNTLVLKNNLEKYIKPLGDGRIEVSSSVLVLELLRHCYENSLDSFYYLSSVPATVGGALAMNAGRGAQYNLSIYDFVESVSFIDGSCGLNTLPINQIARSYRKTIFTGKNNNLITSAIFKFSPVELNENPISTRLIWSKENQDYTAPNCGSVFKKAHFETLDKLKGFKLGGAQFSPKTYNWILNHADDIRFVLLLIWIAQVLHWLNRKKAILEVITID